MKQYQITGMSCAACAARVEQAVQKIDGITSCSVNLLTNSMRVEGLASSEQIIYAVEQAGYHAEEKEKTYKKEDYQTLEDKETPLLQRKLLYSFIFLFALMYVSMGHTMFGFPLPSFFHQNPVACGILQMLLAIVVMGINQRFFIHGYGALFRKAPNMDSLVALGSSASFVYSIYALFLMTHEQSQGNFLSAYSYMHELYFESAAMILVLITLGKMLEARSKGKTTNALKSLMELKPQNAVILVDGIEKTIPAKDVKVQDIFVVKPGESIPIDGILLEGTSAINEATLTGESIPVDKKPGDAVYAATLNQSGYIKCQATKTSEDTTLAQIIQMVSDAAATKAPIAKVADKVSGVFVPFVIAIAMITAIIWLILGETLGFALARAISVLVISCPCALGLATPVAIMVGSGVGAKNGILFKTAASLEETGRIETIALDKTGTITKGEPEVTDLLPNEGISKEELLSMAYSLEKKSEHPLAAAIVNKATKLHIESTETIDFQTFSGNGISATIQDRVTFGGNFCFVSTHAKIPDKAKKSAEQLAHQGKTPLFFAEKNRFLGIIGVADTIKEDSAAAIKELQQMGIHVIMLTGDNILTANAIQKQIGADEVIAQVLPAEKEKVIQSLKKNGKTAMVGDGINDAPALTAAHIGIAIGVGTDVAMDAADVVLMKSSLSDVPAAIRLSKAVLKNIHQNLFWAFLYNTIGIPLAAGLLIPVFGLRLNPMFGAAAMSLSSFCVVTNALRLNLCNIRSKTNEKNKEMKNMKITMKIEGMMCPHCEARVKKVLEETNGVSEALVSHETGSATVVLTEDVSMETLKQVVEQQGYTVLD